MARGRVFVDVVGKIKRRAVARINPPRFPPLGTTFCRQARICDQFGNCRWQGLATILNSNQSSIDLTDAAANGRLPGWSAVSKARAGFRCVSRTDEPAHNKGATIM